MSSFVVGGRVVLDERRSTLASPEWLKQAELYTIKAIVPVPEGLSSDGVHTHRELVGSDTWLTLVISEAQNPTVSAALLRPATAEEVNRHANSIL